MLINAGS